jgi:flagellar FliL protein
MSDEESLSLEDVGAEAEELAVGGRKAGFLPSFLIRILKWVAIGLGFIILGVTTTVVTMNFVNRGRQGEGVRAISPQEMRAKAEPLQYDDTIDAIRGVTSDSPPALFNAEVSIGYEQGNTQVAFELNARKRQIQNEILLAISNKTRDELRPEKYGALQEELKNRINSFMTEGQIKAVAFREFVVTE